MRFEEPPQLPLTSRRKWLVGLGIAMFAAQVVAAVALAPTTTGDNANGAALASFCALSVPWSVAASLLLIRQADMPDVATASFVVTIAAYAAFTLSAAFDARGSKNEVDLVDALFLGVTVGALVALVVWAIAMGAARLLRLPTTKELRDAG